MGGRLFDITDDGVISRLDLKTGEASGASSRRQVQRFTGRFRRVLRGVGSMAKGYVFTLADEPELLAENTLPDGCNASPALLADSIIVRTTSSLYRLKAGAKPN
ncbi:MAG: hypothetical protein U0930_24395 [Pirellulales bacterium]